MPARLDGRMKKKFTLNLRFSIWLTTLIVSILILLFALTVNHAREKAIVEQFSRQQATIAGGAAAGIEDLMAGVERSMTILSTLPPLEKVGCDETVRSIQAIYDDLGGKVESIVRLDGKGTVLCGYPQKLMEGTVGRSFADYSFFYQSRESKRSYVGPLELTEKRRGAGEEGYFQSIVVGVPELDEKGAFAGFVMAVLPLKTIVERYIHPVEELAPLDYWIIDEKGTFIIHSSRDLIGRSIGFIPGNQGKDLRDMLRAEGKGYGQYVFRNDAGEVARNIIAFAPIHLGNATWSFAVVTPYEAVITLVRKAFFNIMLGAGGLILVVIVTGLSIARSSAKGLQLREEVKRLKEREEWQGKLLREKKIVEGTIEGSPVPIFVINRDHKVIFWNRSCAELTGVSAREIIGTDHHYRPFYKDKRPLIADLIIDGDEAAAQKYYGVEKIRRSESVDGALEARDTFESIGGKKRHLYFLAAPIYDEKGDITAAIETIQDVSHEEEMAENLREYAASIEREKKTIEGVVEGSPIPTFVVNRDHKIIFWNRACAELTNFGADVMVGTDKHYLPFYREKRPVIADFIIDGNIEGLEHYYGTKRVQKSDRVKGAYEARDFFENLGGRDRYLYFIAAPIYDEKGEITGAIETLQDISREKEMAEDLREYADNLQAELKENIKLRKEIEELYNYLQSIIESLPDKIFDLSADGIINYVSHDMKKEGGVSREIKGLHFTEFVEKEHRDFVLARWQEVKKGIFRPYELEVTARDGTRRNLFISPRPVKGTDRFVLVQRDVTDLKNLEKKYYESQKLAAVGQLSAGIAHEVRNPLSSIKMSLQILEKRMNPEGNDLKRFKIAQREVEHLEKLVNDVLIFAKPLSPRKESSDLQSILEHALAMVEKSLKDKRISLRKRFEKNLPLLEVDPAMIEQALINVYSNGIDAMEENGTLLISAQRADKDGKRISIEVEDNGCGIDNADLAHLFNPFFTKKKYGTGLGLSQVKKIIEQHQGSIEILSKPGEGTRFIITLPVVSGDDAEVMGTDRDEEEGARV